MVKLMRRAVDACALDLRGAVVLTEAATGAYSVTPILAALAGAARVYAFGRPSRHGSWDDILREISGLATATGVGSQLVLLDQLSASVAGEADLVTNSGHLRPLGPDILQKMKPTAVIPLMYEAWEIRETDIDLPTCRSRGIAYAGTNERNPALPVFPFLGTMAVKLALDAGIEVIGTSIGVLCDNDFAPFIRKGLVDSGARVFLWNGWSDAIAHGDLDVLLVAMKPGATALDGGKIARLRESCPDIIVLHYWGDIDQAALSREGLASWPNPAPKNGHMGILLSDLGPEPVIRLQASGLKVGELLLRARRTGAGVEDAVALAVSEGWATAITGASFGRS